MNYSIVLLIAIVSCVAAKATTWDPSTSVESDWDPSATIDKRASGIIMNDGKLVIQYDDPKVFQKNYCQECFNFFLSEDGSDWHYRFIYHSFLELEADGSTCCYGTSCDPTPGTCNYHAVVTPLDPSMAISSPSQYNTIFSGVYTAPGGVTCNPPGTDSQFCGNFQFNDVMITDATNVTVANGQTMAIDGSTKRTTIRMDTWPFNAGSKGMRIKFLTSVTGTGVEGYRAFPLNAPVTKPYVLTAIGIETYYRMAMISFSPVARLNGTTNGTPVNVTGPYPHEYDLNARYFYIDVPPFVSMEYDLFTRVLFDDLSGSNGAGCVTFSIFTLAIVTLVALLF